VAVGRSVSVVCGAELPAGGDAQFGEDLAQVPLDGVGADEQLGPDLGIGESLPGQTRDLGLLSGEFRGSGDDMPGHRLTDGLRLAAGALGEGTGTEPGEHLMSRPQSGAGVGATVLAAKPFPVQQMRPGELDADAGTAESLGRLAVERLGRVPLGEEGLRAGPDAQCPVRAGGVGRLGQPLQRDGGRATLTAAHGGLDQLGQSPAPRTTRTALRPAFTTEHSRSSTSHSLRRPRSCPKGSSPTLRIRLRR
jgi:hypothetical protein